MKKQRSKRSRCVREKNMISKTYKVRKLLFLEMNFVFQNNSFYFSLSSYLTLNEIYSKYSILLQNLILQLLTEILNECKCSVLNKYFFNPPASNALSKILPKWIVWLLKLFLDKKTLKIQPHVSHSTSARVLLFVWV